MLQRNPTVTPIAAVLVGLAFAVVSSVTSADPIDPVNVFFPRGQCETETLGVELWDRNARAWVPHPDHPEIPVDRCQVEEAGSLLNEIRVRCVDPAGQRTASEWVVGVSVFPLIPSESCDSPLESAAP